MSIDARDSTPETVRGQIGGIPVRNLWLLMLYASELFRCGLRGKVAIEENPDDIADLVAEILSHMVQHRLRRNLTYGYRPEHAVLGRVRGHISLLVTERRQLLSRGLIACRFENLTVNTPRNRFVRGALEKIARIVRDRDLARRCGSLSVSLNRLGVSGVMPTCIEVSTDRYGHHDADDQLMLAAAQLACDLALPMEAEGDVSLPLPEREIAWVRRLFEKAVGGFYDVVLSSQGWHVDRGRTINWQMGQRTAGIDRILPAMRADIVLDHYEARRRIVIDTKFTSIVKPGWYREESLSSGYLYQIYAYLRSQEGNGDPLSDHSVGLLLYPSVGTMVGEAVVVQGHEIRFETVDLGATAGEIREQLIRIVEPMRTYAHQPCVG